MRSFQQASSVRALLATVGLFAGGIGDDLPLLERGSAAEPKAESIAGDAKEAVVPLNKNGTVLLDKAGKRLLLKTQVVLREGTLEQFCCLKQTKEHESILSLDAKAYTVHAGLLALGAKPGTPVKFEPAYQAPTGQRIDLFVSWTDSKGKLQRAPAQSWVRHATRRFWVAKLDPLPSDLKLPKNSELRYENRLKELSWYGPMSPEQKKTFLNLSRNKDYRKAIEQFFEQGQSREMKAAWVFAGSGFYKDEDTGQDYYLAEDGDLICVANFPGATLDLAVESSAQGDSLLFEAWTERIPEKGTPVTLELVLVPEKPSEAPPK